MDISMDITTTKGEKFTYEDQKLMACLIFRRFGRDSVAFCAAWRRLLQNDADFEIMTLIMSPDRAYDAPDGRKLTYYEASLYPCTGKSPCPSCAVNEDDRSDRDCS